MRYIPELRHFPLLPLLIIFSHIDLGYLVYSLDYLIKGMQHLLSSPKTEQGFY
jgi:hypothetical protein